MTKLIKSASDYGTTPDYTRGFVYRDYDGKLHWQEGIIEEGVKEGDTDFFYYDKNGSHVRLAAEFVKIGSVDGKSSDAFAFADTPGFIQNKTQRDEAEEDEDEKNTRGKKRVVPPFIHPPNI